MSTEENKLLSNVTFSIWISRTQKAPPNTSHPTNAVLITRIVDGKVKEDWLNADFMGLMQQLGVIPTAGQGGS